MTEPVRIQCPVIDPGELAALTCGTSVLLSGTLITARDAAHIRLHELIHAGTSLPVDLHGQVLYYVGAAPAPPGRPVGAAGPTTAPYTPELLEQGLKGMIGKGYRSEVVNQALKSHGAVYFGAIGGLGALLSQCIVDQRLLAFADLGPEAMYAFDVRDFPAIVLIDSQGRDFYHETQAFWKSAIDPRDNHEPL